MRRSQAVGRRPNSQRTAEGEADLVRLALGLFFACAARAKRSPATPSAQRSSVAARWLQ
jgi:hypothetical protein